MATIEEQISTLEQREASLTAETDELRRRVDEGDRSKASLLRDRGSQLDSVKRELINLRNLQPTVSQLPEAEQERIGAEVSSRLRRISIRARVEERERIAGVREPRLKEEVTTTRLPPRKLTQLDVERAKIQREDKQRRAEELKRFGAGGVILKPSEVKGIEDLERVEQEEFRIVSQGGDILPLQKGGEVTGSQVLTEPVITATGTGKPFGFTDFLAEKSPSFLLAKQKVVSFGETKFGTVLQEQVGIVTPRTSPTRAEQIRGSSAFAGVILATTPVSISGGFQTVAFKGATQTISARQVVTDIGFRTGAGKVGQARGFTRIFIDGGRLTLGKTTVVGIGGRKVVEPQIRKISAVPEQVFISGERTLAIRTGRITEQLAKGQVVSGTRRAGEIRTFRASDVAVTKARKTISTGITVFDRGGAVGSFGITSPKIKPLSFKKRPRDTISFGGTLDQTFIRGTRRLRVTDIRTGAITEITVPKSTLRSLSLQAQIRTQAGVRAGVSVPPLRVSPVSRAQQTGQITTPISTLPRAQVQVPTARVIQITTPRVTQAQIQVPRTRVQQIQTPRVRVEQIQLPRTRTTQIQTPRVRQGQLQPPRVQLRQRLGDPQVRPRVTRITIPPRIPTIFPTFRTPRRAVRQQGLFGVQVRRGGRFRGAGGGLPLERAITLGAGRVRTTPATAFKITGGGITGGLRTPRGFKQRRERVFVQQRIRI